MPSAASDVLRGAWSRGLGLIVPALLVASILVIVVPLPAALLDLLLAANLSLSALILLTALYVPKPLDFSVFPSLLLGTTLMRLVLNIASTRLILTRAGSDGTGAAGGVIRAFGEFVAGDKVAVGLILFAILVAIQFLVITKGATRISEVAARFALDGMPGRQAAIDADLSAGLIDADGAGRRRREIAAQADFYAAMDGAGKFVRGDALAAVVITLINIVGGLYMGLVELNMPLGESLVVFTKLTIGDGLVTQVPALLISLASALLVTRSSADNDLPGEIIGQIFLRPEALGVSAVFLGMLSFTGLPRLPLLVLAGGLAVVGVIGTRNRQRRQAEADAAPPAPLPPAPSAESRPEDKLLVSALSLELGYGLIRLADSRAAGDLLERVTRVRHTIAQELGIIVPGVKISDSLRLHQRQYQIRLHDIPVAVGEVFPDGLLAIDTGGIEEELAGVPAQEPASGRPAVWIEPEQRERAEGAGFHVVEPGAVIAAHLTEVIRRHSDELLSREQVHQLLEHLKQRSPKLVEELIPGVLKPGQVHQVLCHLLHERVPIRQLETVLETLGDSADRTKDPWLLTEFVRHALGRTICQQYRDRQRVLRVVTLDPAIEDRIEREVQVGAQGLSISLSPRVAEAITRGIEEQLEPLTGRGYPTVVLTAAPVRAAVKKLTEEALPALAVLSLNEITRDTQVEVVGQVELILGTDTPYQSLARAG
ncbi:MAG: flagellar biosynthesis protein FlhA [Planctomycetales bacterium]